jgi:hypothetical protein
MSIPPGYGQKVTKNFGGGYTVLNVPLEQLRKEKRDERSCQGAAIGACFGFFARDCVEAKCLALGIKNVGLLTCLSWTPCLVMTIGCCILGHTLEDPDLKK